MVNHASNSRKRAGWSLGDVLDFECLIKQGAEGSVAEGQAIIARLGLKSLDEMSRHMLFREWIALRREQMEVFHGREFDRIFRLARAMMWVSGTILGGVSAAGYLAYFGREPVNVFWFWFWLVFFPLLLTLSAFLFGFVAKDSNEPAEIARWLFGKLFRQFPNRMRRAWEEWCGVVEKHHRHLASIVAWPLLGMTQRFACAFGLGALVALLGFLLFKDIAFGWQSTFGGSAEAWHTFTWVVAWPCSWVFSSGCPSLESVRASQYTHVGGMAALDPAATRAWWPFLVGCLAVWSVGFRSRSDWVDRLERTERAEGVHSQTRCGHAHRSQRALPKTRSCMDDTQLPTFRDAVFHGTESADARGNSGKLARFGC